MKDQALFDKIDLHLIRVLNTVLTDTPISPMTAGCLGK
jgi:hypothetical protein